MRSDLGSGAGAMARGAGVNLLGMGATTVVGFVFAFAVTHVISAHDFGLYSLATSVLALAFLPGLLGLDTGVIRFVALGAGAIALWMGDLARRVWPRRQGNLADR